MKRSNYVLASARSTAVLFFLMLCGGHLFSQQNLESNFRMTGDGVLAVFEPQRQAIQKCSAALYDGRDLVSYGVVISTDGFILSKASEIENIAKLDVRVDTGIFKDAKIVMIDPRWDVALVKIDAVGLTPAEYAPDSKLTKGTWVVVNGATSRMRRRILAGIISANEREIPAEGGAVLGVVLEKSEDKLVVKSVAEGSGAGQAGMKIGDEIVSIEGDAVKDIAGLSDLLNEAKAGAKARILVKRGGKNIELDVRLSSRGELFREISRNDQMSGDFSNRRSGFPKILQHDILASSKTMGGPVLDLDGRVIGMNIARANRAETFAIPVEDLKSLAEGMVAQSRESQPD